MDDRRRTMTHRLLLTAASFTLLACSGPVGGRDQPCREDHTCAGEWVCVENVCRDALGSDVFDVPIDHPASDTSDVTDARADTFDAADAPSDLVDVVDDGDVAVDVPVIDSAPDVAPVDGAMCPEPDGDAGTCASHQAVAITLGTPVCGVSSGASSIPSSSCQSLTGGPEAAFSFTLSHETGVSLTVRGTFDSVLTVRRTCETPSDEVACNDVQGGTASSSLRAVLPAGTYYAVVDEFGSGGTGGNFVLESGTYMPAMNARCANADPLRGTMMVSGVSIETGDSTSTVCRTIDHGAERFYSLTVMAGQTLTALATSTPGWRIALHAFDACDSTANCLADAASTTAMPNPTLTWTNHGSAPRDVILAVAAVDDPVPAGAQYTMGVTLTP
jgi:hypothetical protein